MKIDFSAQLERSGLSINEVVRRLGIPKNQRLMVSHWLRGISDVPEKYRERINGILGLPEQEPQERTGSDVLSEDSIRARRRRVKECLNEHSVSIADFGREIGTPRSTISMFITTTQKTKNSSVLWALLFLRFGWPEFAPQDEAERAALEEVKSIGGYDAYVKNTRDKKDETLIEAEAVTEPEPSNEIEIFIAGEADDRRGRERRAILGVFGQMMEALHSFDVTGGKKTESDANEITVQLMAAIAEVASVSRSQETAEMIWSNKSFAADMLTLARIIKRLGQSLEASLKRRDEKADFRIGTKAVKDVQAALEIVRTIYPTDFQNFSDNDRAILKQILQVVSLDLANVANNL